MPITSGTDGASGVQAVSLAVRLLELLAASAEPVGITELAKRIGTTKARVYRYLRALVEHGYVLQDPVSERYMLGHGVFTLARSAKMHQNFSRITQPIMIALAREVMQSVALTEPSKNGVTVIDVVRSDQPLDINTRVGSLFSLHASAQGWVALAFGRPELWEGVGDPPYRKETPHTIATREDLERVVAKVQDQGWASAPEQLLIGINALAAPIRDGTGKLAFTIAVVGSLQHVTDPPATYQVDALLAAASKISNALGYIDRSDGSGN